MLDGQRFGSRIRRYFVGDANQGRESIAEIDGFLDAVKSRMQLLSAPANSRYAPVIIPSWQRCPQTPQLDALIGTALGARGVPVLVHGVRTDAGRTASAEIWQALKGNL